MMTILRRFRSDARGASHEALAIAAAVITVVCLLGAHFLEQLSRSGALPRIAIISSDGKATSLGRIVAALPRSGQAPDTTNGRFGDVDFTTTGSLPGNPTRPVILDPCAGQAK